MSNQIDCNILLGPIGLHVIFWLTPGVKFDRKNWREEFGRKYLHSYTIIKCNFLVLQLGGLSFFKDVICNKYIHLAKPKSGAPGLFILTGCRISENERLWNCPPFGFPGNCLIMSFSSLPN